MTHHPYIGFQRFLEMMKEQTEKRCKERDGDLFIIICGDEGVGKSLFTLALACYVDPSFTVERIFYRWKQYQKLLKSAMKHIGLTFNQDVLKKSFDTVGASYENLMKEDDVALAHGSVLVYDEAGSGMSNRSSQDKEVKEQYRALQRMRHLRQVHLWCAPKLHVIDVYAREERIKFFIYIDDQGTLDEPKRVAHIWSRTSLRRIFSDVYWRQNFLRGIGFILKHYTPDYSVPIPNLKHIWNGKYYVEPQLFEEYKMRKLGCDYMEGEKDEVEQSKKQLDDVKKIAKMPRAELKKMLMDQGIHERTAQRYCTTLDKIVSSSGGAL